MRVRVRVRVRGDYERDIEFLDAGVCYGCWWVRKPKENISIAGACPGAGE